VQVHIFELEVSSSFGNLHYFEHETLTVVQLVHLGMILAGLTISEFFLKKLIEIKMGNQILYALYEKL